MSRKTISREINSVLIFFFLSRFLVDHKVSALIEIRQISMGAASSGRIISPSPCVSSVCVSEINEKQSVSPHMVRNMYVGARVCRLSRVTIFNFIDDWTQMSQNDEQMNLWKVFEQLFRLSKSNFGFSGSGMCLSVR